MINYLNKIDFKNAFLELTAFVLPGLAKAGEFRVDYRTLCGEGGGAVLSVSNTRWHWRLFNNWGYADQGSLPGLGKRPWLRSNLIPISITGPGTETCKARCINTRVGLEDFSHLIMLVLTPNYHHYLVDRSLSQRKNLFTQLHIRTEIFMLLCLCVYTSLSRTVFIMLCPDLTQSRCVLRTTWSSESVDLNSGCYSCPFVLSFQNHYATLKFSCVFLN